ncbi:GPW/gp25 family protein [Rhodoferax sp. BAB1]|uniref:GPW/gp25 family protein n=1 Tax=Rhodoferax sp. BAB1 TaxID=2741720 RepID=UPI00157606F8|nr:GPW/gp25 family protein [Rhodoferax sp. BAB1]QKO21824.1 GPW/gp25 family protein [Rhodoferax sp. BAB1]
MKLQNGKHLAFPFRVGDDGRMRTVRTLDEHIRDEIVQLILTNQGERPFLVDFGGGVRRLVFEAADEATGAVAKATITQAINRWLGHRVVLDFIKVDIENATITVDIRYRLAGTEESHLLRFQREGT